MVVRLRILNCLIFVRWHGLCSIAQQMALKVKGLQVDTLQEEVQQITVDMKRTQKVVHHI